VEGNKPIEAVLGIDTSNYTTSVALTDREGNILADVRRLLPVKEGSRGIRQSEAHFLHIKALPELMAQAFQSGPYQLKATAASSRPRPIEGSYMPVFTAGTTVAASIASALAIPYKEFSHQEGHLEAVQRYSSFSREGALIALHLSGGTCEILKVRSGEISIIGGSRDISFGQLIDRYGVALGLPFPAGPALEALAKKETAPSGILTPIKAPGLWFNLSGPETQLMKHLGKEGLSRELFEKISKLLVDVLKQARKETGIQRILSSGGVSENQIIRCHLQKEFGDSIAFGPPGLSSDNAVGISLLGGKNLWP
jgi:N6-L-threonylcarbamoyladenine synthase